MPTVPPTAAGAESARIKEPHERTITPCVAPLYTPSIGTPWCAQSPPRCECRRAPPTAAGWCTKHPHETCCHIQRTIVPCAAPLLTPASNPIHRHPMLCATASGRRSKAPHEQMHERPAAPFTSAPLVQTRTVTPRRDPIVTLPPASVVTGCPRRETAKRIPPPGLLEEALATIDPTCRRERLRMTRVPLHSALRRCLMSAPNWFYASLAMVFTLY
ncbi:hypothetical protein B0H13DRAFT_2431881 [Mycena leptocephala]|nr:hypothetical protein B0H13DRAFT_2431881 [Mycena leptocephala]